MNYHIDQDSSSEDLNLLIVAHILLWTYRPTLHSQEPQAPALLCITLMLFPCSFLAVYFLHSGLFPLLSSSNSSNFTSITFLCEPLLRDTVSLISVKNVLFYGLTGTFSSTVLIAYRTFDQIRREDE